MANKLLLLADVDSLGRSGELVTVRPGYARNFLIPHGYAVIADARTLRMQTKLQEERQKKAADERKESEEFASKLEGIALEKIVKVDHDGHMYGSVTAQDIQQLIEEVSGIHIDKKSIQLAHAIKKTGTHTIQLKLKEGVVVESIVLNVLPEESDALKASK